MVDTATFTIEGPDGESDELELPTELLDLLSEEGDTQTEVIGDMAILSFAQQAHAIVHHSQGEVDENLQQIEEETLAQFEERFGVSFAEATGHSH